MSFPSSLGVVFSSDLWDDLSGPENLRLLASIKGQVGGVEIEEALVRVGLDAEDGRPYRSYSLGMKRRLQIAQAIMERPRLLIMDEPLNSLDSDGLGMLVGILREERSRGATMLLASHNSAELEALCDRKFKVESGRVSELAR